MGRRSACVVALVLATCAAARAEMNLEFRKSGGQPLTAVQAQAVVSLELWLTNMAVTTTSLSAFQFYFDAGGFGANQLIASDWTLDPSFFGLSPSFVQFDGSLDTAAEDVLVSGVSGSLTTPFVGPSLPYGQAVMIAQLDVFVQAPPGSMVDFLIGGKSGVDNQNGDLGGRGLRQFGTLGVPVLPVPEPAGLLLWLSALSAASGRRRRRR